MADSWLAATRLKERVAAEVADAYGRSNDRDIDAMLRAAARGRGRQVDYRQRCAPADVLLTVVVAKDGLSNYVPSAAKVPAARCST